MLWSAEILTGSVSPSCLCCQLDGPCVQYQCCPAPVSTTNDKHFKSNQAVYPSHLDQDTKVRKSEGKDILERTIADYGRKQCLLK